MAKSYLLRFGSANPSTNTGLSPTFTVFSVLPGYSAIAAPPGITESPALSGLYSFVYAPVVPIAFVCDGGASLTANSRYLVGILDPIQAVDQQVGISSDSYGSTSVDPTTLWGMAKRVQENLEGNASFDKSTGIWSIKTRGGTLIQTKVLVNSTSTVTKS